MRNNHYYTATLRGDEEPKVIENVFSFQYPSQRKQWLKEVGEGWGNKDIRVQITSKITKKHLPIEVTFRSAERLGATIHTWFYNQIPEWLAMQ